MTDPMTQTWWERVQARDATSHDADAPVQMPGDTYRRRGVDRRELIRVVEYFKTAIKLAREVLDQNGHYQYDVMQMDKALALLDRPAEEVDNGK